VFRQADNKVAVLVPHSGRVDYLNRALASVSSQSFRNFEVFISNDLSNERNFAEISKMAYSSFPEIKFHFIQSTRASGAAATRNSALERIESLGAFEYVAFLDDDDEWCSCKLESQVKFMEENQSQFTHHDYKRVTSNGKVSRISTRRNSGAREVAVSEILFGLCFIATPTVMLRLDAKVELSSLFPEEMTLGEDHRAWIKYLQASDCELMHIPLDGARVNLNPTSIQKSLSPYRSLVERYRETKARRAFAKAMGISRPPGFLGRSLINLARAVHNRFFPGRQKTIKHLCEIG
jgi:glycosyltransferase involved in cell wall biosynthesis